ncbi:hypothetical protein OESDEN_13087, partial [Oesophagostomum dentatum]
PKSPASSAIASAPITPLSGPSRSSSRASDFIGNDAMGDIESCCQNTPQEIRKICAFIDNNTQLGNLATKSNPADILSEVKQENGGDFFLFVKSFSDCPLQGARIASSVYL